MSTRQPASQEPEPRRRVSLRTPLTLLVLLAILLGGAYYGWRAFTGEVPSTAAEPRAAKPKSSCTPGVVKPGHQLATRDVRVSVFNAGGITGLADKTLGRLSQRGFRSGTVGNAPNGSGVRAVQVWDKHPHSAEVRLVALQFKANVKRVRPKDNLGPGVDVVVGDNFPGFRASAPKSLKVKAKQTTDCAPKGGSSS